MIFPIFNGFLSYAKAPVTWILFGLNLVFFIGASILEIGPSGQLDKLLTNKNLINTTGRMFAQFVKTNPEHFSADVFQMSKTLTFADKENGYLLGGFALSQKYFWDNYKDFKFQGDRVAIADWRDTMIEIEKVQLTHPQFLLGVRGVPDSENNFYRWISYQFTHSGLFHFAGNMVYLLLFGAFLEPILGGLMLLVGYLMSGAIAAAVFLLISGESNLPLVGASGAISGLMAITTVLMWTKPVRYFYVWFLPKRNYLGFVMLPAWLTFLVWLVPDLAGFLSSHEFSGGIAFIAHLGGELAGILTGLTILVMTKMKQSGFKLLFNKTA